MIPYRPLQHRDVLLLRAAVLPQHDQRLARPSATDPEEDRPWLQAVRDEPEFAAAVRTRVRGLRSAERRSRTPGIRSERYRRPTSAATVAAAARDVTPSLR